MKNEKFIEVREKTNKAIKAYIKEKIIQGIIKDVNYGYDGDSNLTCVTCTVSLLKESDIDDVKDIISTEIYRAIIDCCIKENLDEWFGALLPDVVVENISTISRLHNLIATETEA